MLFAGIRVILQIILFGIFLYVYGLSALEKLNEQNTIVVKTTKNTKGMQVPSITIAARNLDNGLGWKKKADYIKPDDMLAHQCKNFSSVEDCLDSETFPRHSFIKDALLGYHAKLSLMNRTNTWSPDFTHVIKGRSYKFHPKLMVGPSYSEDQIIILLGKEYRYDIFVHDEDFFILNSNEGALPSKIVKLSPSTLDHTKFYYKIVAIQHIEKNVHGDPCVEDNQYSFTT